MKEKLPEKFEGLTFLGKLKNNPAPAEEENLNSHQCHNVIVLPISSLWGHQTAFSSAALKRNTPITLHSQSQVRKLNENGVLSSVTLDLTKKKPGNWPTN